MVFLRDEIRISESTHDYFILEYWMESYKIM